MTAEQSAALKKKIGGSYRGFFKEWVEARNDTRAAPRTRSSAKRACSNLHRAVVSVSVRFAFLARCLACAHCHTDMRRLGCCVMTQQPKGDAVDEGIVFYDEKTGEDFSTSSVAYAPLLAATLLGVGAVLAVLVARTS